MLELHDGSLDAMHILKKWYDKEVRHNYGACIPFIGTIRDEDGIDGLSFDIYEPILEKWFSNWQDKAKEKNAYITMAHSKGDVFLHESSFVCCIFSPKRVLALELIALFVEDFKASAPIWKYDLKNKQRLYALDRSTAIQGSGLLGIKK